MKWFEKGNNTDPKTRQKLSINTLYTNYNLRGAIDHVRDSLPENQRNAEKIHRESLAVGRMEEIVRGKKDVLENELDNFIKNHFRILDKKNMELEQLKVKFQQALTNQKKVTDEMYKLIKSIKSNVQSGVNSKCHKCGVFTEYYYNCLSCSFITCIKCTPAYLCNSNNDLSKVNLNSLNKFIVIKDKFNLNKSDSSILVRGSIDKTIKIWNMSSETCRTTLYGHTQTIRAIIKINNNTIVSCSEDMLIKLWDIKLSKCIKTLYGHMAAVCTIIKMNENFLVSGSEDMTIIVWRLDLGKSTYFLNGHTSAIRTLLKFDNKTFISGSSDHTIKVWNIESGVCLRTLIDHTGSVYSLILINSNTFASGSSDNTIKTWNIITGECIKTLTINDNKISSLVKINDYTIVSSSIDGKVNLWNINKGTLIKTLQSYSCWVLSELKIDNSTIAFVSANNTIRTLNIETGVTKSIITDHKGDVTTLAYLI